MCWVGKGRLEIVNVGVTMQVDVTTVLDYSGEDKVEDVREVHPLPTVPFTRPCTHLANPPGFLLVFLFSPIPPTPLHDMTARVA